MNAFLAVEYMFTFDVETGTLCLILWLLFDCYKELAYEVHMIIQKDRAFYQYWIMEVSS